MKSNCGTLVIDDFGRQRMSTDELLNRWIVPLEKRHRLSQPAQRQEDPSAVRPADHLLDEPRAARTWSTRRSCGEFPTRSKSAIRRKTEFRQLFKLMAPKLGFEYRDEPIDYLIETHYIAGGRPFRNCQPRDLLLQVRNRCFYENLPAELTSEAFRLGGRELLCDDVTA